MAYGAIVIIASVTGPRICCDVGYAARSTGGLLEILNRVKKAIRRL
jgi:hypothetical protein